MRHGQRCALPHPGKQVELLLDHSTDYYVGVSLLWVAGITLVFGTLAVTRFARR